MSSLHPNPMICRSGAALYWAATLYDDGFWYAEIGVQGRWSEKVRWEQVGAPKNNKPDAEKTAIDFALIRAGKM